MVKSRWYDLMIELCFQRRMKSIYTMNLFLISIIFLWVYLKIQNTEFVRRREPLQRDAILWTDGRYLRGRKSSSLVVELYGVLAQPGSCFFTHRRVVAANTAQLWSPQARSWRYRRNSQWNMGKTKLRRFSWKVFIFWCSKKDSRVRLPKKADLHRSLRRYQPTFCPSGKQRRMWSQSHVAWLADGARAAIFSLRSNWRLLTRYYGDGDMTQRLWSSRESLHRSLQTMFIHTTKC